MLKIKFFRIQKGLSQRQLGELLHISPSAVSQVEQGIRQPWPKLRRQLAEVLGVTEDELFAADGSCLEAAEDFITMPINRR